MDSKEYQMDTIKCKFPRNTNIQSFTATFLPFAVEWHWKN